MGILITNMINSLYQLVNKGSFRTLSFLLALGLTIAFFLNIHGFSTALRTASPIVVLSIIWGIVTSWIHGIGFDIRTSLLKLILSPLIGYITGCFAVISHFLR